MEGCIKGEVAGGVNGVWFNEELAVIEGAEVIDKGENDCELGRVTPSKTGLIA